jgi:hypothetical protein
MRQPTKPRKQKENKMKITKLRITHNSKNDSGEYRTTDGELHDDGSHITKPSNHPGGGSRVILAPSGDFDTAFRRAKDMSWPFWIGGAGYSDLPRKIEVID